MQTPTIITSFILGFERIEQPDLRPFNNRGEYELMEDAEYQWLDNTPSDKLPTANTPFQARLTIKKGFITDVASVPRIFWSLGYSPDGMYRGAALIHDLLYQLEGRVRGDSERYRYEEYNIAEQKWEIKPRVFNRKDCDEIFKQAMIALGVFGARAWVMHKAVNIFGALAW